MEKLNELRLQLDEIDAQIVELLNKRMSVVDEIADWKIENDSCIADPSREINVIEHAMKVVEHPVLLDFISKIYTTIMDCAKASQVLKQHSVHPFHHIGIIGLGLMGGSIAKTLKAKKSSVVLSTLKGHFHDVQEALDKGFIDNCYSSMRELAESSDLIIMATPISTIIPLAKGIAEAAKLAKRKLVIMDIASVKGDIVRAFERLSNSSLEYVATHPMAGAELSGFQHSFSTLFIHAPWVMTPHSKNSHQTLNNIDQLIRFLGAVPITLEAHMHDRQVALISHLPSRISFNILNFVKQMDPSSLEIAGPGFKSMTRLAHCNPILRSEITSFNRKNIEEYLDRWVKYVQQGEAS